MLEDSQNISPFLLGETEKDMKIKNKNKFIKGFTLLELLVVVLIIGILAAIALPQYKKATEKSNAIEALTILKSLWESQQNYYLLHNTYALKFADLDIYIPWTGNVKWRTGTSYIRDTLSNNKWSLQIYKGASDNYCYLYLGRISGQYKGSGFTITCGPEMTLWCAERIDDGIIFEGDEGDYCRKIFSTGKKSSDSSANLTKFINPKF